jgi:hypothetical protein
LYMHGQMTTEKHTHRLPTVTYGITADPRPPDDEKDSTSSTVLSSLVITRSERTVKASISPMWEYNAPQARESPYGDSD